MSTVPECRFGYECRRIDCWFSHFQGRRIDDPTSIGIQPMMMPDMSQQMMMPSMYQLPVDLSANTQQQQPPQPKNNNCRYGRECRREGCHFNHPDGRKVDEGESNDQEDDDIDDALDEFEADMAAQSMGKLRLQEGGADGEDFVCPCCNNNPYNCATCGDAGVCTCLAGGVDDDDDSWRDEWFPESRTCECCNGYAYRCEHKLRSCNDEKCECLSTMSSPNALQPTTATTEPSATESA
jgi:hypothetical protein